MTENLQDRAWYIIQTPPGAEEVAKRNLENKFYSLGKEEYLFEVLIPKREVEKRNKKGEVRIVEERIYPGYVFLNMVMTKETWFIVRNTSPVTGILGSSGGGTGPIVVSDEEMEELFVICGKKEPLRFEGAVGDKVEVISGPFAGREGEIEFIDEEKENVTVLIDLFGRLTSTELTFRDIKLKK